MCCDVHDNPTTGKCVLNHALILIKGYEVEAAHEAAQIFLNYCTCAQVKVEWMYHRAHYGCVFFPVFVSHLFRYCWCLGLKVPDILDG